MNDCCKTKLRDESEKKALINRLSRIEGQVKGVKNMMQNDAYCVDVLIQVSAISAAINSFSKELLESHIKTCVADDIKADNYETIDELIAVLRKLMK
jgi:DNA-binding FrmR family transcriptional regulator